MKDQRQYCRDILARIEQIERFTFDGRDHFFADDRTQEAVIRCFEVIGEAVKRLDSRLTEQYPDLNWRAYAGFRDVLIHHYDRIQLEKVWDAAQNDLGPLAVAIRHLVDILDDETS